MRSLKTSTAAAPLTILVGGTAAAGVSPGLAVVVDGARVTLNTTGGHTPAQAAAALEAAIDSALGAEYDVTVDSATVSIARADGGVVTGTAVTRDSGLTVTIGGRAADRRELAAVVTEFTGRPQGYTDGLAVGGRIDGDDGQVVEGQAAVVVAVRLRNGSNGAKTAYWRLWWWSDTVGWFADQELGARLISDAGTAAPYYTDDVVQVIGPGSRVAVEVIGAAATGTTLSGTGVAVDAWIERV